MEGSAEAQQGAAAMAGLLQQLAALEKSDQAEFERVMTLLEKDAEAKMAQGAQNHAEATPRQAAFTASRNSLPVLMQAESSPSALQA